MTSLRRLAVGPFVLETALSFDELDESRLRLSLQPPVLAINDHPRRVVTVDEIRDLRQGKTIAVGSLPELGSGTEIAIIDEHEILIGIARFESEKRRLQPQIVFPAPR